MLGLRHVLGVAVGAGVLAGWAVANATMMNPVGPAVPSLSLTAEPGLTCPDAASLERELSAVVTMRFAAETSTQTSMPAPGAAPRWALSVARVPQGVAMVLRDPGGAIVMVRTVAVFPSRCEIAAQAIAIIVERHFRDLVTAADVPPAPALARSGEAGRPEATVAAQASVPSGPAPAPTRFTSLPRWTVGLGPGYWTRLDRPSMVLDARVRVGPVMVLGLGTLLPWFTFDQTLTSGGGRARSAGMPVIAQVGAGGRRGRFGASAGFQGVISIEKGHTEGIPATAAAWRTVLATGAVVGAAIDVGTRLRVAADLSLCRAVLGRSYQVDGAGVVLEPPAWQAIFGVRLEWAIFV